MTSSAGVSFRPFPGSGVASGRSGRHAPGPAPGPPPGACLSRSGPPGRGCEPSCRLGAVTGRRMKAPGLTLGLGLPVTLGCVLGA